jgi:type IV secretory pathway VirB2 component (pilin)
MRLTRVTRGLGVAAMVVGVSFAFAAPALAAGNHEGTHQVRSMVPFSSLNWSPATQRTAHSEIRSMRPFSDMNAFGPVPVVVPVTVTSPPTQTTSHAWSTDWRTTVLTIVTGLLAVSLAVVGAGYVRNRRLARIALP